MAVDVAIASMGSLAVMDGVHTEGQGRGRMEGTLVYSMLPPFDEHGN